jgi:hypothetical protein
MDELVPDRVEGEVLDAALGDDHQVDGPGVQLRMKAKHLADETLDPIPHDGLADLARHRDANPRLGGGSRLDVVDEAPPVEATPALLNVEELAALSQSPGRRERERSPARIFHVPLLLRDRHHEALAALAAASRQDLAAPGGRDPAAEPVLVEALTITRLVCSLHDCLFQQVEVPGSESVPGARGGEGNRSLAGLSRTFLAEVLPRKCLRILHDPDHPRRAPRGRPDRRDRRVMVSSSNSNG